MPDLAAELAAAVADRPGWTLEGDTAVLRDGLRTVTVRPTAMPTGWRDRWSAVETVAGVARFAVLRASAAEVVRWAETER
jgi:hypothetical protein